MIVPRLSTTLLSDCSEAKVVTWVLSIWHIQIFVHYTYVHDKSSFNYCTFKRFTAGHGDWQLNILCMERTFEVHSQEIFSCQENMSYFPKSQQLYLEITFLPQCMKGNSKLHYVWKHIVYCRYITLVICTHGKTNTNPM